MTRMRRIAPRGDTAPLPTSVMVCEHPTVDASSAIPGISRRTQDCHTSALLGAECRDADRLESAEAVNWRADVGSVVAMIRGSNSMRTMRHH